MTFNLSNKSNHRTVRCFFGSFFLCIGFFLICRDCIADDSSWQKHMDEGAALFEQEDFSKAERAYELAVKDAEGKDSGDLLTATALMEQADMCCRLEKLDTAETLYKRALALREKHFGLDHPNVAEVLLGLGYNSKRQGRLLINTAAGANPLTNPMYAEAEQLYRRALTIYEKAEGPNHINVARCLDRLAMVYRWQKRSNADVDALVNRSCAIKASAHSRHERAIVVGLNNLAKSLDRDRPGYSNPEITAALKVLKNPKINNSNSAGDLTKAVILLNNMGVTCMNKKLYRDAEKLFDEAAVLDPIYWLAYENRSIARKTLGNLKGAKEDKARALKLVN